jgi:pSer/pThr/pTyr-binding forkhead associated (FHA) protein
MVVVIGGNNRGTEFPLKLGDNSLGRGIDNDVVLADIAVSRKHTLICFENGAFVVRDLGSGNGTLLNSSRVDSHTLRDGDQLELGNTLLRFVNPGGGAELSALATVITPRDQFPKGPAPAVPEPQNVTTEEAPKPSAARRRWLANLPQGTRRLVLIGSIALVGFLGAMVGVKAFLVAKKRRDLAAIKAAQQSSAEIVLQEFQKGVTEFNAKNWATARKHFRSVLALDPNETQVRRLLEESEMEVVANEALEKVRERLAALDYPAARLEIGKVKTGSRYHTEAEALARKIDEEQVAKLLGAAKNLQGTGDISGALEKVKEAQSISPGSEGVKELLAALNEAASKRGGTRRVVPAHTPVTRAPKKAERPKAAPKEMSKPPPEERPIHVSASGQSKAAMPLYKKKDFAGAYQALRLSADSLKGKKQRAAKTLADAVHAVGQSWGRASTARDSGQALKYYQETLANDQKVDRGYHQKELRDLIAKTARKQATDALAKRKYRHAFEAVMLAEKYGGKGDPATGKVLKALEAQAEQLFNWAYSHKKDDPKRAKEAWKAILHMVPTSSPIYTKAYQWLNRAGGQSLDEDEE